MKKPASSNNQNCISRDLVIQFTIIVSFFTDDLFLIGIRQNHKKINEHNAIIGEKIQSLRSHQRIQPTLPSPILSRSTHAKQDVVVAPAQSSSRKLFHLNYCSNKQILSFYSCKNQNSIAHHICSSSTINNVSSSYQYFRSSTSAKSSNATNNHSSLD